MALGGGRDFRAHQAHRYCSRQSKAPPAWRAYRLEHACQVQRHCNEVSCAFVLIVPNTYHIYVLVFLGRSKRIKDLAVGYGYKGIIAGTRKTTPGKLPLQAAWSAHDHQGFGWSKSME